MNTKFKKNTLLLVLIVILETMLIKFFQYKVLPNKFFYDSNLILGIMNSSYVGDNSFQYVANLFTKINFFRFTTLQQWSMAIAIVATIIIVYFLLKNKQYKIHQFIFIIASVALLNIYVFNLSKDIVQFIFFLLLFIILKSKMKNIYKLILSCILLLYEALNFRVYYAIMAMVMVTIYFIYQLLIKNKTLNKKHVIKIIMIFIIAFFIEVFFVQLFSENNYNAILNARYVVNINRQNSTDAVTIINDPLGYNTNYVIFIINYIINFIRINLPIELLFKSIKYIPFIAYQIYIFYHISKNIKNVNDNNILWIDAIVSFIIISTIFEPDFGSFIRHEVSLILILIELTIFSEKLKFSNNKADTL